MTRTQITVMLLASLATPAVAPAQNVDDAIAKAVLAAPAALRANAMVILMGADGTHTVLREGSNGLVCWDRSDEPSRSFSVQCTNEENLPRVKQNRVWSLSGQSADELRATRDAAEADGTREVSTFGSAYYSLSGEDAASANLHTTIAVPFATSDSLGLPDEGNYTGAGTWIMEAGTTAAHIMLPGQ